MFNSWHSTDTCPSVGDSPTSSHLGTPRTLDNLMETHQPQAILALSMACNSEMLETPNRSTVHHRALEVAHLHITTCPIRGQQSQTLSASVRHWALLQHTLRPLATTPTHCVIHHDVQAVLSTHARSSTCPSPYQCLDVLALQLA